MSKLGTPSWVPPENQDINTESTCQGGKKPRFFLGSGEKSQSGSGQNWYGKYTIASTVLCWIEIYLNKFN